jgi:hypothetical protein
MVKFNSNKINTSLLPWDTKYLHFKLCQFNRIIIKPWWKYLLTNPIGQNPSWEVCQERPCLFWRIDSSFSAVPIPGSMKWFLSSEGDRLANKFQNYRTKSFTIMCHYTVPLVPILKQKNSVHTPYLRSLSSILILFSHLQIRLPDPLKASWQKCIFTSHLF